MAKTSPKRPRLNIYLDGEEMKRQVRIAAAKRDLSITEYCTRAIEEQLMREGERPRHQKEDLKIPDEKLDLLARIDERRQRIGPIGVRASELIKEGRRR